MIRQRKFIIYLIIIIHLIFIAYLYAYQNKYTISGDEQLDVLVDNWYIYPDQLLEDGQLNNYQGIATWLGQYPNFSKLSSSNSSFGKATYETTYNYSGNETTLSMYIQEPFSAVKIYVNGELIGQNGSIQPYRPLIKDVIVSFKAKRNNHIVIQVENNTHYYSGLYYPVVIGNTSALSKVVFTRIAFYGLMCFSSLAISLYSLVLWMQDRQNKNHQLQLHLGVFSLAFAIYCAYPFSKLIYTPAGRITYAIEDSMMMLCLYCVLRICLSLYNGKFKAKISQIMLPIAFAMIWIVFFFSLVLLKYLPDFLNVYGLMISAYKLVVALNIVVMAFDCCRKGAGNEILYGTFSYGLYLIAGIILINYYEPISLGWLEEIGMYILLVCFAVVMIKRWHVLLKEHQLLSVHLQDEVERQTKDIQGLLEERQTLLSELLHDLKRPMSISNSYVQLILNHDISLDADMKKQLAIIEAKQEQMNQQIKQLQTINELEQIKYDFARTDLNTFIKEFYELYLPDVEVSQQNFIYQVPSSICYCNIDKLALQRVLQNLLFNALRYTKSNNTIKITLSTQDNKAVITFEDNGIGIKEEHLLKVFQKAFTTLDDSENKGLGLYICKNIILAHHGEIAVESEEGVQTKFIITLPIIE